MKIVNIEINKEWNTVLIHEERNIKLIPVILTTKNFFGRTKTFKAFPTNYGPTFGSDIIHYFVFVNELGEKLPDEISEQINNFLKINKFLDKL